MSKIKHNKYKNSGILFELLVRQITSDMLEGKDSPIKGLLKKYFVKTELGKEYKLYEALLKHTSLTEGKANVVLESLIEASKTLNRGAIKRQKYNLIKEIKETYDLNKFFNHKLPNYKTQAALYTLIESSSTPKLVSTEQVIINKLTLLEHLTHSTVKIKKEENEILNEITDKDTRILAYKILLEKFNSKYDGLNSPQKQILKEIINSIDNQPRLKEFYIEKLTEIKLILEKLNKKTTNPVSQIKINEIISSIQLPTKTQKIKDDNLVDLLQYYDLIKELKIANEKSQKTSHTVI